MNISTLLCLVIHALLYQTVLSPAIAWSASMEGCVSGEPACPHGYDRNIRLTEDARLQCCWKPSAGCSRKRRDIEEDRAGKRPNRIEQQHCSRAFSLAKGRKVVFYDQRGNGRSSELKDGQPCGLAEQIDDLDALRAHLGFEKIDLLGHSWGG
jgi:hypothetical protein